jgi:hypothetical protein
LAQLRLAVLPLQVEVGHLTSKRDENTGQIIKHKYNERIGTLCESDEVEDEIHFVCVCALYAICLILFRYRMKNILIRVMKINLFI